jgi:lambda family phage minor tail protein L
MAVAAWAASTPYSVGDIRRAATAQVTGLFFKVTAVDTSGDSPYTSGGAEPKWGTDIGSTVVDNVIKAEGFEYSSGGGSLPRPTLTVSNVSSLNVPGQVNVAGITALLLLVNATTPGNDLGGATVKRIRTLKRYLDGESTADPFAQFPQEIWYIDRKASENRNLVSFELASKFDLPGVYLSRRQVISSVCQWAYKSSECNYTPGKKFDINDNPLPDDSTADVCGKRLNSCKIRFESDGQDGILNFGGFPGAGQFR